MTQINGTVADGFGPDPAGGAICQPDAEISRALSAVLAIGLFDRSVSASTSIDSTTMPRGVKSLVSTIVRLSL